MTILQHLPIAEQTAGISTTCENQGLHRLGRDKAELPKDLQPCYFPCLDSSSVSDGDWQSVEVPFRDALRLQTFCKEHGISSLAVLQTAWALVLRCYVGGNSFFLGHLVPRANSHLDGEGPAWAACFDFATYHMELEETDTVMGILHAKEADHSRPQARQPVYVDIRAMEPSAPLYNTALQVREVKTLHTLTASRSLLQSGACQGANNVSKTTYLSMECVWVVRTLWDSSTDMISRSKFWLTSVSVTTVSLLTSTMFNQNYQSCLPRTWLTLLQN